jgi:hypothetical protein
LSLLLSRKSLKAIEKEVDANVAALYSLGKLHFDFAVGLSNADWRQKISRLYYAAYNAKRSISLKSDGTFSTDSTDHKHISLLPDSLPNKATYSVKLANLREDRNLCDYSHLAVVSNLMIPVGEAESVVREFLQECRAFLRDRGVSV